MTTANDLRLAWLEKARVALKAKAVWMAAPAKPCQEDDELRDRAAFAFDERNAAWAAFVAAEWDEVNQGFWFDRWPTDSAESGMEDER